MTFPFNDNGTRTPPSHDVRFEPRSGALFDPFVPLANVGPPLSLKKNTIVLSSGASSTLPIPSFNLFGSPPIPPPPALPEQRGL